MPSPGHLLLSDTYMASGEYWMGVGVTALSFPRNGIGGGSTLRSPPGTHAGLGTFTRTSVVLTAADLSGVTRGDYIFTNNGYWGIVDVADNGTKLVTLQSPWQTSITVGGIPGGIPKVDLVPSGATSVSIHNGNHPASARKFSGQMNPAASPPFSRITVRRILVGAHANAGTIVITDAAGTAQITITLPAPATQDHSGMSTDIGFTSREPFGVTTTGAGIVVYVFYDMDPDA